MDSGVWGPILKWILESGVNFKMDSKVRSLGSAPEFGVVVQFLMGTWSPEIGIGTRSSELQSNFKMDSGVRSPILKWILESGVQF